MVRKEIRIAWVILLGGLLTQWTACSDRGQPMAPGTNDLPIEDPNADDATKDEASRPLFFEPDRLKKTWDRGESCLAMSPLIDIFSKDQDIWTVDLHGDIRLSLRYEQQGLWLTLDDPESQLQGAVIEVDLSRLRLDEWAWLEPSDVLTFRWSKNDVLIKLASGWQSMRNSSLVEVWSQGQERGLFLANVLADTALASLVWGMNLKSIESNSRSRILGHWFFQGSAPVWKGLMTSQRCHFQQPDFELETVEIWDESSNFPMDPAVFSKLMSINRSGLIDALITMRHFRELPISVPVLIVPSSVQKNWQTDKPGSRLIKRSIASSEQVHVRQEMLVYQDAFYFMTRRILMESLTSDQAFWTKVIAWALTDIHLLAERGLYEQVIFFQRSLPKQIENHHPRQLAHLLAHRFSYIDLIRPWQACRKYHAAEFQPCLLEGIFGTKLPAEMAIWVLNGDDFHPDWHPDLVSDEDGDGLIKLLEQRMGTDPRVVDTDDDGWTDFAEAIHGTDGRSPVSHPPGLSIDGWFDDWIRLLPHKVKANPKKQASACSDIQLLYFSAFHSEDWLLFGAKLENQNSQVRWEINLDFSGSDSKFFVSLESGQHTLHIKREGTDAVVLSRPFQNQATDLELLIEGDWLKRLLLAANGETDDLDLTEDLSVKIAVFSGDGSDNWKFCEDTPWFEPSAVNISKP